MTGFVVEPFGGPGGWAEGLRQIRPDLHARAIGFEIEPWACATRAAAGHRTIRADVSTWPLERLAGKVEGLIASPPCPDWSAAGSRTGRAGKTGWLIDEPMRWVEALEPEWVAFEQVPPALEVWRHHAHRLRELGYSAWAGVLCAADYGVPQTRRRAILLASRSGPALPPETTHGEYPGLFPPNGWVPMHVAVGWRGILDTRRDQRPDGSTQKVHTSRPAPTVTGASIGQWLLNGEPVTVPELSVLQGFRPDYPWQGTKSRQGIQLGNAVPPPFAAAILGALIPAVSERVA